MKPTRPLPGCGSADEKARLRRVVERRQLVGAANDTAWGKLLDTMRRNERASPSYRLKVIDCEPSYWDTEWTHHLPFPMMSIEWMDIRLVERIHPGQLIEPEVVDHRGWILQALNDAKLCHEVRGEIVRVFGYLPKSFDGLE